MTRNYVDCHWATSMYAECVRNTAVIGAVQRGFNIDAWHAAQDKEMDAWRLMTWFNHGDMNDFGEVEAGAALVRFAQRTDYVGMIARTLLSNLVPVVFPEPVTS